jgi:hypothetical protein
VAQQLPEGDDEDPGQEKPGRQEEAGEGAGPRFRKGSEDLDQLEGIEKQQGRSRRAKRQQEHDDSGGEPAPDDTYPAIDDIEKSRRRLKNRFKDIKDYEDAIDEFGS